MQRDAKVEALSDLRNSEREIMVIVVIPTYEPRELLIDYCKELKDKGCEKILVVDDGSGDKYSHIMDQIRDIEGCTVLTHPFNMGKGKALKTAFSWIMDNEPDVLGCVTADSDGQHLAKDVVSCIQSLESHPQSLVLGVRDFSEPDIPPRNKYGNLFLLKLYKIFRRADLKDSQTGLRGYPIEYMKLCITVKGNRFDFENRALIAAIKQCIPIVETPIEAVYDNYTTHFSPVKDSLIAYFIVMEEAIRFGVSSLICACVDLFLFYVFCGVFEPIVGDGNIICAAIVARLCSSILNFTLNYKFVFHSQENVGQTVLKYYILLIVQVLISGVAVTFLAKILPISETLIKAFVDTIIFIANYLIQRIFFAKRK